MFGIYQIPREKQTGSEWERLVGSRQWTVISRQSSVGSRQSKVESQKVD